MKINLELVGELTELRTSSSVLRFPVARYRIVGKSKRARQVVKVWSLADAFANSLKIDPKQPRSSWILHRGL
ncbi:hypothetical protein K0M31_010108 [Melipona bicolor]|uniref:Uncharacterized protein n=1 Tax=Melipona bicolor TaxID=60889 RepID=A0AA40KIQ4_9HYME|nr:hypothetical protein K0M31_010108 [Melipona bicolor]